MKKISKGLIALIIVLVCVLGVSSFYKNTYNSLVSMDESVSASWAEVQNQYQRRLQTATCEAAGGFHLPLTDVSFPLCKTD